MTGLQKLKLGLCHWRVYNSSREQKIFLFIAIKRDYFNSHKIDRDKTSYEILEGEEIQSNFGLQVSSQEKIVDGKAGKFESGWENFEEVSWHLLVILLLRPQS